MKQNDKDLLIKDLCGRLPYGVKISVNDKVETLQGINILDNAVEYGSFLSSDIEEVKPYLFPLSSMTEEQEKDIFHNGKFYIDNHNSLCRFPTNEDDYNFVTVEDCLKIFNKLIKNHFDIYGLIPMGLAEDATGLNIY